MIKLAATIGLCTALASSGPAAAGNGWNNNWQSGGGIGPGAAVALGLGSLALGTALARPWTGFYVPPLVNYYTPPYPYAYQPRWCVNPYGQYYVC